MGPKRLDMGYGVKRGQIYVPSIHIGDVLPTGDVPVCWIAALASFERLNCIKVCPYMT